MKKRYYHCPYWINLDRRKVYCDRQELELTAKEYNLLCLLAANKGRALTHAQIYVKVWGDDAIQNPEDYEARSNIV